MWDGSDEYGLLPDEMLSFVSVLSLSEVTVHPGSHKPLSSLPDGDVRGVCDALKDFYTRMPELPRLQHARVQPLVDHPANDPIGHPSVEEAAQVPVVKRVEKRHYVHLPGSWAAHTHVPRSQTPPWAVDVLA